MRYHKSMGKLFTRSFFKFTFGFIAILILSFAFIFTVGLFSEKQDNNAETQAQTNALEN